MDDKFRVEVLEQTHNPQTLCWQAMHQDYSEIATADATPPDEKRAGELVVKHLLAGHKGHYGPLEHPQITFNVIGFPHSVMSQARTHRVGISFDVQSFRYTGDRISKVADGTNEELEDVFYLRPVGTYHDRQGNKVEYTETYREEDLELIRLCAKRYKERVEQGFPPEHARSTIPHDTRQHFVMSLNLRSMMHLFDLRAKKDAQLEIQTMIELIYPLFEIWTPEIAEWYTDNRYQKARLSP